MLSVLKFGGSSLRNSASVGRAVDIIQKKANQSRTMVVVSAIAGVTDQLILMAERCTEPTFELEDQIQTLRDMHQNILEDLLENTSNRKNNEIDQFIEARLDELRDCIKNLINSDNPSKEIRDQILSIGERLSAYIVSAILADSGLSSQSYESQNFVRTNDRFSEADVDTIVTRKLIRESLLPIKDNVPVVTGFIGSTEEHKITTLGRSGSDYSASLVAEAVEADEVEIWTDVNGILTADPHIVPNAEPISELNYDDIAELAQHGAKVIHPKTITPLYGNNITLWVKNSYHPEQKGTLVTEKPTTNGSFRSVTVTGPYLFLNLYSQNYHPITRYTDSLLQLFKAHNISFEYVNSQKSDEQIRLLLKTSYTNKVEELVQQWEGYPEAAVEHKNEVYQIKFFSNQLKANTRLSRAVAAMLSKKGLNPISFEKAAGARFLNLLVAREEAFLTARLINDHICKGHHTVHVFLAGLGTIGGNLLQQIIDLEQLPFDMNIIGACNSRKMIWNDHGIPPSQIMDKLESEGETTDWKTIIERLSEPQRYRTIFVDATGNNEVASHYADLMETGIHIATPSKRANSGKQSYFNRLKQLKEEELIEYEYETTVGAGLPILNTLMELQRNGDQVTQISGVVSGTMTYVFNELENGNAFADTIAQARELGYAEPDPRDDLSGEDVVRKFMILARTLNQNIERNEIEVTSLVPDDLRNSDVDTFMGDLSNYNDIWKEKMESAAKEDKTLRYVGTLENGNIKIGVETLPKNSPLGQLKGTDNLVQIYTERYSHSPIVIQGPGAGKEVTASGLLNDVIKIGTRITD